MLMSKPFPDAVWILPTCSLDQRQLTSMTTTIGGVHVRTDVVTQSFNVYRFLPNKRPGRF